MKHIFIINPNAGREDSSADVQQQITRYAEAHAGFDFLTYITTAPADATRFADR